MNMYQKAKQWLAKDMDGREYMLKKAFWWMLTCLQRPPSLKHNFHCVSWLEAFLRYRLCPYLHSSLLYITAINNANNFTLTGNCCFSFNSSYKDSCSVHCFLMCRNEVLQRLLFNLWGIELDAPPIFTEMEMILAWMRACLSQVLIGCLCLFVLWRRCRLGSLCSIDMQPGLKLSHMVIGH